MQTNDYEIEENSTKAYGLDIVTDGTVSGSASSIVLSWKIFNDRN